jgi:hypothetical protein
LLGLNIIRSGFGVGLLLQILSMLSRLTLEQVSMLGPEDIRTQLLQTELLLLVVHVMHSIQLRVRVVGLDEAAEVTVFGK